ncbi:MAG TPA: Ig-like domain-containing protein, partial [Thermoplasmata archaeon]|nr:Ig-like domain-containing protein [Thermoplasmata archaeon]
VGHTFIWNAQADSVTLTSTKRLNAGTQYTMTVSTAATSAAGENLSAAVTWSFTTEAWTAPPVQPAAGIDAGMLVLGLILGLVVGLIVGMIMFKKKRSEPASAAEADRSLEDSKEPVEDAKAPEETPAESAAEPKSPPPPPPGKSDKPLPYIPPPDSKK